MKRRLLLAALVAASFGSVATVASAQVIVRIAPPPLRAERMPPARRGRVWVAGHWEWRNRRYNWVEGYWIRERRGYRYNQPQWVERDGRWVQQRGNWSRGDRDGDGVPNRTDRDRDGDGVRNSQDRMPNNPNRN